LRNLGANRNGTERDHRHFQPVNSARALSFPKKSHAIEENEKIFEKRSTLPLSGTVGRRLRTGQAHRLGRGSTQADA
jgi:hypothetical protein